jgi:hypothetical protein
MFWARLGLKAMALAFQNQWPSHLALVDFSWFWLSFGLDTKATLKPSDIQREMIMMLIYISHKWLLGGPSSADHAALGNRCKQS